MAQEGALKKRTCAHCGGKFGLILYRSGFNRFCSRNCQEAHGRLIDRLLTEQRRWLAYLARGSPS